MCGIVILNYNSYDMTCNLVKKIIDFHNIIKIVIIDNNSNDDFTTFVNEVNNNKITYIKNNDNTGYAAGNNLGLRYLYSHGIKYGFVANPDVIFDEKTIDDIYDFMKNNSQYGVVSCKRTMHENGPTGQFWELLSFNDCLKETFYIGRKKLHNKAIKKFKSIWDDKESVYKDVEVVGGAFFGCNLEIMNKVDYMDERTFLWYEENILAMKLKNNDYKEGFLYTCSYIHNHSKKNYGNKNHKIYVNSRRIYCKYYLNKNNFSLLILDFLNIFGLLEAKILYIIGKVIKR